MVSVFPSLIGLVAGARVLVAGGTGRVGSGVTLAALKQGARVTVVTRSADRFEKLKESISPNFHPGLSVAMGDLTTEEGVRDVFEKSTKMTGGVQHLVTAIRDRKRNWEKDKSLIAHHLRSFQSIAIEEATPHFLLMKAFLPYLDAQLGSSYTAVTGYPGPATLPIKDPSPPQWLATGTVRALVDGARAEFRKGRVAVNEVHLNCQVQKEPDDELVPLGPQKLGKDLVGSAIAAVVSSNIRDRVVISSRRSARSWAGSKYVYVTKSSTRIFPTSSGGKRASA